MCASPRGEDALYNTLPGLIVQGRWAEAHEINKQVIITTLNAEMDCYRAYCTGDPGIEAQCNSLIDTISRMKELYQHTIIMFWERNAKSVGQDYVKPLYEFTRTVDQLVDKLKRIRHNNGVPTDLSSRKNIVETMIEEIQGAAALLNPAEPLQAAEESLSSGAESN